MKRLLGSLFLVAALAAPVACGGASDDSVTDPATASSAPDAAEVVAIVGGSAAGGDVARSITILDSAQAVRRYLRQFRSTAFAGDVQDALDAHPPAAGRVLGAAVIDVSCDIAPSATVAENGGTYVVTPGKVPDPHPECVAAVTSVAVVDLPA